MLAPPVKYDHSLKGGRAIRTVLSPTNAITIIMISAQAVIISSTVQTTLEAREYSKTLRLRLKVIKVKRREGERDVKREAKRERVREGERKKGGKARARNLPTN